MRFLKGIFQTISVALLLFLIWIAITIGNLFTIRDDKKLLEHVPDDAQIVAVFDTRVMFNELAKLVSGKEPDKDLQVLLDEMVRGRIKKFKFTERMGVHVLGKIVFFHSEHNQTGINGFICQVNDAKAFQKYFTKPAYFSEVQQGIGVVTMNEDAIDEREQMAYTNRIAKEKSTFLKKIGVSNLDGKMASVFWNVGQQKWNFGLDYISLSLRFLNEFLHVDGQIQVANSELLNRASPNMRKNGIQFSSSLIPALPETIRSYFRSFFGSNIPKLKGFCLNYRGITVKLGPPVEVLPEADLLLEFDRSFSINDWLSNQALSSLFGFRYDAGKLSFSGGDFHCKQLKPNRIYIGQDEQPMILPDDDLHLIRLRGSLGTLLNVKGSPLVSAFINFLPGISSIKQLANDMEEFDMRLVRTNDGQAKLRATLAFPTGKNAFSEGIKLLLSSDFFKQ